MKKNEFLRRAPKRKTTNIVVDFLNWILPLLSLISGFWISTQWFARLMNYDPSVVGYPLFIIKKLHNYRLYHPGIYFLAFIKYAFKPGYGPYFSASIKPALIGFCITLFLIFFFAILRNLMQHSDNLYGTARWGNDKDLKKCGLLQELGMVCGQLQKANISAKVNNGSIKLTTHSNAKLICHSGKTNTLLVAPTRSGKGVSVIIPSLLNYPGSVIVFDPKGENWNITAGYRKQFSHVLKFSPLSKETIRFNPMDEIREGDSAYADANQIADILFTGDTKSGGDETAQFFSESAKNITTGVILHVRFCNKFKEKNLSTVLKIMAEAANEKSDDDGLQSALVDDLKNSEHESELIHELIVGCANQLTNNPKERASVFSTAFAKLQLFRDPLLANATSSSDFKISDFIESKSPISLYLTVPFAHIDRVSLVFRLLINFMLRKFSEGETSFGEIKLKNHLVFFLDEFPVLGYFPFIAKVMGILAGYGVTFLIVCQALNQIIDIYGQNHPFLDHCQTIIAFQPKKIEDAKMFSETIGKESVVHDSTSTSGRKFNIMLDNVNLSSQEVARDLINPDELIKMPLEQCLILSTGTPPYLGKKVVYFDDERFKDKAFLSVPVKREELLLECKDLPSNNGIDLNKKDKDKVNEIQKQKEIQKRNEARKRRQELFEPLPDENTPHFTDKPDPDLEVLIQMWSEIQEKEEAENQKILKANEKIEEDGAYDEAF